MGILADLLKQRLGIQTRNVENPLTAVVGGTAIPILLNEPDRVGFIIINLSPNNIYISPLPTVAFIEGICIEGNGGWRSFTWDADFELCSHAWYAIAAEDASDIFITENIGVK